MQTCSNCGAANSATSKFCLRCGTALAASHPIVDSSWTEPSPIPPQWTATNMLPQPEMPSGAIQIADLGTRLDGGTATGRPPAGPAIPIADLGTRLDGWADILLGAGAQAQMVAESFEQQLLAQNMPVVKIVPETLTPGGWSGKRRSYYLVQIEPGASMAVYINRFGENLYLAWDMYVRPIIRWPILVIALCLIFALPALACFVGYNGDFLTRLAYAGVGGSTALLIITLLCSPAAGVGLLFGAGLIGLIQRGNATAFFIKEIDTFTADDITAMMMSVHKTLLAALDEAGLKTDLLHEKDRFFAGQRTRLI